MKFLFRPDEERDKPSAEFPRTNPAGDRHLGIRRYIKITSWFYLFGSDAVLAALKKLYQVEPKNR